VPKAYGYFVAYALMALCMALAVCVYRAGRHGYKVHPLQERSALFSVAKALFDCARTGCWRAAFVCLGMWCLLGSIILSCCKALAPASGSAMMWAAFACAGIGTLTVVLPCINPSWLRAEGAEPTADQAEVQGFLRILPVLFTGNLAFGALYNSMQFWYQQQACQMDLRVPFSTTGSQFSGSFFMIADCLGIVVATPLAVDWLNPLLEKELGGRFGHGAKFGLGMSFGALSVFVATRFEMLRRAAPVLGLASNCAPSGVSMSAFGSVWMALPYFLMGMGEIYTQPVLMHFAYRHSPPSMRTLAAATGLVIGAVSTSLFTVQVAALSSYVPNDLNHGHLEYGYVSNILLGAGLYAAYLGALRRFEEQQVLGH